MKNALRFALPGQPFAAPAPPPAEEADGDDEPTQRFADGAAVRVKGDPHMAGQATGDVVKGQVTDVYTVQFDGADGPFSYYLGDELEPDDEEDPEGTGPKSKPPGAAARASAPPLARGFAVSLVRASGLAPGASVAAATAKATEMLGDAAWTRQATAAKTSAEMRGTVSAALRSHAALPGIQAELAALRATIDSGKRLAVLEKGIANGVWTPGKAWLNGDKTKGPSAWAAAPHKGPKGEQLGQSLEQLEADLATSVPLSFAGAGAKPVESALSAEELPAAGANGATPEQWTAARNSVLTGTLPTRPTKTTKTRAPR